MITFLKYFLLPIFVVALEVINIYSIIQLSSMELSESMSGVGPPNSEAVLLTSMSGALIFSWLIVNAFIFIPISIRYVDKKNNILIFLSIGILITTTLLMLLDIPILYIIIIKLIHYSFILLGLQTLLVLLVERSR